MVNNVQLPAKFFVKTAQRDYNEPREAFFREFLQNSVDAGSKNIDFTITKEIVNGREKTFFSCNDDGCGMTEDVIRNKLLVLGETSKENTNSTGGFGVAKILIYFAHEYYEIRTLDNIVKGSGGTYSIEKSDTFVKGCHAKVEINPEIFSSNALASYLEYEIERSYLPEIKITVNGSQVTANKKKGRQVVNLEKVTIHKRKTDCNDNYYALVRVNGLNMFRQYIGSKPYELIIELKGYSTDILTTNRDGFKGDWRRKIDVALEEITSDPSKEKAATSKTNFFVGKSSRMTPTTEQALETVTNLINEKMETLNSDELLTFVADQVKELEDKIGAANAEKVHLKIKTEIAVSMIKGMKLTIHDLKDILAYNVPIKTVGKFRKVPINWNPANFTDKQNKLLSLWGKILGLVLRDTGHGDITFEAGYIFDDSNTDDVILAQYDTTTGRHTFYLNPMKYGDQNFFPMAANRRTEVIIWLVSLAIHEVTHYAGFSGHNYEFVAQETTYKMMVFKNINEYLKLTF